MRYTNFVDPFLGNGEIDLPKPSYPASTWHFIKGLTGNTAPAAVLPFGKYSCMGYSGGYPHGYGINDENCGGPIRKIFNKPHFVGLSHFHHNGTGAVGVYYNYALTHPFFDETPDFIPKEVLEEIAQPGYFAARTENVFAEATVSEYAAAHRYTFTKSGKLAVDFANDGLYADDRKMRGKAKGTVTICSETRAAAQMQMQGITVWFCVECIGGKIEGLFKGKERYHCSEMTLEQPQDIRFGCIIDAGSSCEMRVSVSLISGEYAAKQLESEGRSFDDIRAAASEKWEKELEKIEISTEDPRERQIFYSNLYHTLIKPCDWSGEAFPFREHDGTFMLDIITMWDIYKTQLPLLLTLWPDTAEKILKTLERFCREYGRYPHALILSGNLNIESNQGRMLAEYFICDAYYRGLKADYPELLRLAKIDGQRFEDYFAENCEYASHTLDMGEVFAAMTIVAERLGLDDLAREFRQNSRHLWCAFAEDGIMRPTSDYYEGNRYNYSFRCMNDMKTRLAISGGERIEWEAKRFFGFENAEDFTSRFEGFNNETDMEAPYFLHDIGRRDLLSQVIVSGMDSMFTTGKGGIPGNADCGGLPSCYLWNVLGIFPISGQDRMIIGVPRYERSVMHMPNGDFEIIREGKGIYTRSACFNGVELDNFELPASEMIKGGTLKIIMSENP